MNRTGRTVLIATAIAGALALTGCTGDAGTDSGDGAAQELNPQAQAAADIVATVTEPVNEFTAPGPAFDVAAAAGGTVYYIPATLQVPVLSALGDSVTAALEEADVKVQICDAKANPADAGSCIAQAVAADAAGVITVGMPYEFAPAAYDSLESAGIPLVYALTTASGDGDPLQVAYVSPGSVDLLSWAANWVIADSNASANVLAIKVTDTPATTGWADAGMIGTYAEKCPDCTVETIEINTGQYDRLPSLVSSALTANPSITYIHMQFDSGLPSVAQGIQASGRDDIKVVSGDGYLSTLQDIEAGRNVTADASANYGALAWYIADASLRMATGQPAVQDLEFPFRRLFTTENVGDLDLTAEGEASGSWFGDADYQGGFLELWGL